MTPRRLLLALSVATTAFMLGGCPSLGYDKLPPTTEASETVKVLTPLYVSDEQIRAADGSVLVGIADVPDTIRVDQETEFGAADRFLGASISPDGAWLAIVTIGAAHSAGWLVREDTWQPRPAAFQYGGNISIGPWSDDARRVVFIQEGPAGDRTLTVVDRERLGEAVEANAMPVRSPDHEERGREERIYEALAWRNGDLLFGVGGEGWIFDPDTGQVRRETPGALRWDKLGE